MDQRHRTQGHGALARWEAPPFWHGFEELGRATGTPPKSLMRMFGPRGNPQATNLFAVLGHLQKHGGFHLAVRTEP